MSAREDVGLDLDALEALWRDNQNRPGGTIAQHHVLAMIARVRAAEATIARVRSLIAREGGTNINIVNRILDELEGSPL